MLNPPHLELKTGCESTPAHPTSPPPRSTSPHLSHHHTSSTYLYSLRSWAGGGGGGAACIRGLTMIKTHREEPLKSPVPKMESLIGAYSARKGFSERKKVLGESNNHYALLPCICQIYTVPSLPPFCYLRESPLKRFHV